MEYEGTEHVLVSLNEI